jgi:OOP family OmpA-OmpF porin
MSAVFIPMRRTMKKFIKVAMVLASAALASAASAQSVDNWRNGTGEHAWKNGSNELCWRDATWTPATAAAGCSTRQMYSDNPRLVADGLNTISAPFKPSARQPSGKWRS